MKLFASSRRELFWEESLSRALYFLPPIRWLVHILVKSFLSSRWYIWKW